MNLKRLSGIKCIIYINKGGEWQWSFWIVVLPKMKLMTRWPESVGIFICLLLRKSVISTFHQIELHEKRLILQKLREIINEILKIQQNTATNHLNPYTHNNLSCYCPLHDNNSWLSVCSFTSSGNNEKLLMFSPVHSIFDEYLASVSVQVRRSNVVSFLIGSTEEHNCINFCRNLCGFIIWILFVFHCVFWPKINVIVSLHWKKYI